MNEVHKITIEVAKPRSSFHGRVEEGYYCIADGDVVLTDQNGKPTGEDKHHLGGGDARLIACAMLRANRRSRATVSALNAPIAYPKTKYL
jgi:hypothetical protein